MILHTWIRASGATVEEVRRWFPPLRQDPLVLTGGTSGDHAVRYASVDALAAGIRPGMSVSSARRRIPALRAMPAPEGVWNTLIADIVEEMNARVSMPHADEFEIITNSNDAPEMILNGVARRCLQHLRAPVSMAVSAVPDVARIAATVPDLVPAVVSPGTERDLLYHIPLTRLWWINPRGIRTLARDWAVFTVGELSSVSPSIVRSLLGTSGRTIQRAIHDRGTPRGATVSCQRVDLTHPTNEYATLHRYLLGIVDSAWSGIARNRQSVKGVELTVTPHDGRPIRMSCRLDPELEDPVSLGHVVVTLLRRLTTRKSVRFLEVRLSPGSPAGIQLPLFSDMGAFRLARLGTALTEIDSRYGSHAIMRACTMRIGV